MTGNGYNGLKSVIKKFGSHYLRSFVDAWLNDEDVTEEEFRKTYGNSSSQIP
jgi:hypothetical protein